MYILFEKNKLSEDKKDGSHANKFMGMNKRMKQTLARIKKTYETRNNVEKELNL